MIVAGIPIALREFHHLLRGWLSFAFLRRNPAAAQARLNFLYFSYRPDFSHLLLSLQTLKATVPVDLVGQVFLAEDQKAPFETAQIAHLSEVHRGLRILPIRDFEWGSPRSTHAELQLFKQICSELPDPLDLLVKVDSDVIFLPNAEKWERLLRSTAPAIGDGHYLGFRYAQGGLYMIRRQVIQSVFASTSVADVEVVARRIDSVGEDMAISYMLKEEGAPFFFTRLMLFPEEYRRLNTLGYLARTEFLALHCHKDKQNMPNLVDRFYLPVMKDGQ